MNKLKLELYAALMALNKQSLPKDKKEEAIIKIVDEYDARVRENKYGIGTISNGSRRTRGSYFADMSGDTLWDTEPATERASTPPRQVTYTGSIESETRNVEDVAPAQETTVVLPNNNTAPVAYTSLTQSMLETYLEELATERSRRILGGEI